MLRRTPNYYACLLLLYFITGITALLYWPVLSF